MSRFTIYTTMELQTVIVMKSHKKVQKARKEILANISNSITTYSSYPTLPE